ncbi:hypothetical protein B0H67DRAFT_640266 [Lasiosphaeris hirsuta]|uniref:Uncharacterized protein n=1 Tax=Lasiosphaeris hirsuta TaxID=260670 RepID=A0AA40BCV7_9PEZI|nr:hypothetical protein B0H67DRAFT_640266 [Lasiosphaeris hirsuta]
MLKSSMDGRFARDEGFHEVPAGCAGQKRVAVDQDSNAYKVQGRRRVCSPQIVAKPHHPSDKSPARYLIDTLLASRCSRTQKRTHKNLDKMCNADGCDDLVYGGFWDIYTWFPQLAFPQGYAFTTLPSSHLRPSPQPEITDSSYDAWNAAYQVWGALRCSGKCQSGYFCKVHGSWITGAEVKNNEAPPPETPADTADKCLALHSDVTAVGNNFSGVVRYIDKASQEAKHDTVQGGLLAYCSH